jgi:hypothetical protein
VGVSHASSFGADRAGLISRWSVHRGAAKGCGFKDLLQHGLTGRVAF